MDANFYYIVSQLFFLKKKIFILRDGFWCIKLHLVEYSNLFPCPDARNRKWYFSAHFIDVVCLSAQNRFLCCGYLFDETHELAMWRNERITLQMKWNLIKGDRQLNWTELSRTELNWTNTHCIRNHNNVGKSYYYC